MAPQHQRRWFLWLPVVCLAIIFIVIVLWLVLRNQNLRTPYNLNLVQYSTPPPGTESIFVSVASYRDERCDFTIRNLFERAAAPRNIYVGLCIQNKRGDPECPERPLCLGGSGECLDDHLRVHRMRHNQAKGPAYARYFCAQLYRGEKYFLQIDSHMEFVQDWDRIIIEQLHKCPVGPGATGAVLTHYPPADMTDQVRKGQVTTHICRGKFEGDGMISFLSMQHGPRKLPMKTYYLAGGFLFGPGRLVREVPYDPHLVYLFWGEELLLAARLWTSGYDIFSPSVAVCSHVYERFDKPNIFTDTASSSSGREHHAQGAGAGAQPGQAAARLGAQQRQAPGDGQVRHGQSPVAGAVPEGVQDRLQQQDGGLALLDHHG